jgi:hypothetical protein
MAASPWLAFLDDASSSALSDGGASPYVGSLVVDDRLLPGAPAGRPLRVRVTGGAGQVPGPVALCARRGLELAALEVALGDPGDPAGNARRVVAALDAAGCTAGHVVVGPEPTPAWLAAADEVAAADLSLCLSLDADPLSVEAWIDAALDRELAFSLVGGTADDAVAAVETTARLWGGDLVSARRWCRSWTCRDVEAAAAVLEGREPGA